MSRTLSAKREKENIDVNYQSLAFFFHRMIQKGVVGVLGNHHNVLQQ